MLQYDCIFTVQTDDETGLHYWVAHCPGDKDVTEYDLEQPLELDPGKFADGYTIRVVGSEYVVAHGRFVWVDDQCAGFIHSCKEMEGKSADVLSVDSHSECRCGAELVLDQTTVAYMIAEE